MKIKHEIDLTHLAPPQPDGFMISQDAHPPRDIHDLEREVMQALGITVEDDDGLPAFYEKRADAEAVLEEMRRRLPDGPLLSLIEIKDGQIRRA